jgi:hypothetical protein
VSTEQVLNTQEISELRKKVMSCIPSAQLIPFPRNQSIIQMLKCSEFYKESCFLDVLIEDKHNGMTLLHQSMDALHFGMRWIFEHCNASRQELTDVRIEKAIQIVFDAAEKYSMVDPLLDLVTGGWGQATRDINGRICISLNDKNACEIECSNRDLTRNSGIRAPNSKRFREPDPKAFGVAVTKAMGKRRKGYTIPSAEFERLRKNHDIEKEVMWRFDPSWDLGGYTFSDLRKFWIVLYTIAMMHSVICQTQNNLKEWILIKRRGWWIIEISKRADLSQEIVSLIVDDLTYDPLFYRKGGAQATIASQPLFPIAEDSLALSNMLVLITDVERNVWELMSRKRGTVFSAAESIKEGSVAKSWAGGRSCLTSAFLMIHYKLNRKGHYWIELNRVICPKNFMLSR